MSIIGTHTCKIDAKGRLALPSAIKNQLGEARDKGFVLKRSVFQPCLELYPIGQWNDLMKRIGKLNRFVKENNDFVRRFMAGVKWISLDDADRILISKDLISYAGLKKEIVLASAIDIIELWDFEAYESVLQSTTLDFAQLAESVMGKQEDKENHENTIS